MEELLKLNTLYMEQNIGMLEERIRWMEKRSGYGESNAPCKVVHLQPKV